MQGIVNRLIKEGIPTPAQRGIVFGAQGIVFRKLNVTNSHVLNSHNEMKR